MIKKSSEFKYSWLTKLFRQVPSSYQAVTFGFAKVKITRSDNTKKIAYLNISDIQTTKRWWWHQIILTSVSGENIHLGGFSKRKAKAIQSIFFKYKEQYRKATEEISEKTSGIIAFSDRIEEIQEGQVWFSKHDLEEMLEKLKALAPVFKLPKRFSSSFVDQRILLRGENS